MMNKLTCFKAYDIRGKLGKELNDDIAYRIGRAFGEYLKPNKVVVGGDIRLTSEALKDALSNGLLDAGVDVIDLGLTGTEEIYFATSHLKVDGGIEVTASHNPMDFNGMKLIREDSKPISGDTGLRETQRLAEENDFPVVDKRGELSKASCMSAYISHLLGYIALDDIKPMKLVVNAGNGLAGIIIDKIEIEFKKRNVPVTFIKVHHQPDGNFPNGIPNPLLPENRSATSDAVIQHQADMGIAWDGDFDRCFLFDEKGEFIEGYYIVGLLAEAFLAKEAGVKIIHDPRLTWNTIDIVESNGGVPVLCKTGHAFIKERMRKENAVYGGEMSAHHYFRDFFYCDSGMIPWLLVIGLLSEKGIPLSMMVKDRINTYPSSGEINFTVSNPVKTIEKISSKYASDALNIDKTDGISFEFSNWRFNLRSSNTEPVIRLNVESKGNLSLLKQKTEELCQELTG